MRFLKYKSNKKLLDDIALLRDISSVTWTQLSLSLSLSLSQVMLGVTFGNVTPLNIF